MRSAAVRKLLRTGRALHGDRLVVFVAPGTGQAAFVASRRVGSAVRRNRARRILRAAWRASRPDAGRDAVVVARPSIEGAGSQDLVTEIAAVLRRDEIRLDEDR